MTDIIPAVFEMLTPDNCCALLVDHQPGLFLNVGDITPLALRNNSIALAKVLRMHRIPTVITCAAQGPAGPMGPRSPRSPRCSRTWSRSTAPRSTPGRTRKSVPRLRRPDAGK